MTWQSPQQNFDLPSHGQQLALRVRDLHKSYRRGGSVTHVLQGVDLDVQQGECVFLAGPSGSGKSTLLSILGCILTPDRGHVQILNQEITTLDQSARTSLRRDRIGFVFQRFQLVRGLTAVDNVQVPLTLQGVRAGKARRRALELLEAVGLSDHSTADPRTLSGGECQRVALARALANDPDVILADEPTASLDADNGREVMQLLRRLIAQEGKTAIVVTHDRRIFPYADRVCTMDNGRIMEEVDYQESNEKDAICA